MAVYIPVYKKMKYSEDAIIERSLPVVGEPLTKEGDPVVPFTKLGKARVSSKILKLDPKIKLSKGNQKGTVIYEGEIIGKEGMFKKVKAPFTGALEEEHNGTLVFAQEKKDSWLLSGLWGTVEKIEGNKSVFIKSQTLDINFVAYTSYFVMGELVVFPNPSELLDLEYLERFSKNTKNKVIYIGNHVRKPVVDTAIEMGIGALIGGSTDKNTFDYADSKGLPLVVTTGFGKLTTPVFIFDFLKSISNRHVFIDGKQGIMRVPMPPENNFKDQQPLGGTLRELAPGLNVLVLEKDHFGKTATILEVMDATIKVKLDKSGEEFQTKVPNIFALV